MHPLCDLGPASSMQAAAAHAGACRIDTNVSRGVGALMDDLKMKHHGQSGPHMPS